MASELPQRARRLIEAKDKYEAEKLAFEDAKRKYRALEAEFWQHLDEDLGVTTLTLELGEPFGKVQLQKRETIKARVIDAETAADSITAAGLGDAILQDVPGVRQKVLNEHVRDWLKSGADLPEGIDFTATRYVSVTRS